jgi:hypothetical protein
MNEAPQDEGVWSSGGRYIYTHVLIFGYYREVSG